MSNATGDDDRDGHDHGQAPRRREGVAVGQEEEREPQRQRRHPARAQCQPGGHAGQPRARGGEQTADAELPGPVEGGEVGRTWGGAGVPHRVGERSDGDQGDHGRQPCGGAHPQAPHPQHRHQHEGRPHDVELLLDREGPVVQQRGRGRLGEVVGARRHEVPVDAEDECPEAVLRHGVAAGGGVDEVERGGRDEHDGHRHRHQSAHAAQVELREADAAVLVDRVDQESGDQEAGEHEEDVEHRVDTRRPPPEVADDDHEDADAAQALQIPPNRCPWAWSRHGRLQMDAGVLVARQNRHGPPVAPMVKPAGGACTTNGTPV